jgi:hypothetical protein
MYFCKCPSIAIDCNLPINAALHSFRRECGSKVLLARKTSIAGPRWPKSDQRISHSTVISGAHKLFRHCPDSARWRLDGSSSVPAESHNRPQKPFVSSVKCLYKHILGFNNPSASDMARWVTHGCVIPHGCLKLAPVTAEAKVREDDELRHHRRIVMNMMEAGARTEKQVLWSADHTLDNRR